MYSTHTSYIKVYCFIQCGLPLPVASRSTASPSVRRGGTARGNGVGGGGGGAPATSNSVTAVLFQQQHTLISGGSSDG